MISLNDDFERIRNDIEQFISGLKAEAVRFEKMGSPYIALAISNCVKFIKIGLDIFEHEADGEKKLEKFNKAFESAYKILKQLKSDIDGGGQDGRC